MKLQTVCIKKFARPTAIHRTAEPSHHPSAASSHFPTASALAGRKSSVAGGTIMRQALPGAADVRLRPGPSFARMRGYLVLDEFGFDKSDLTDLHRKRLAGLAKTLQELLEFYPGGSVRVTGYTDAVGDEGYNLKLGLRRAEVVREALVHDKNSPMPEAAISKESAGEATLKVRTQRANPRNRRVMIEFQPEPGWRLAQSQELTEPTFPEASAPVIPPGVPPTPGFVNPDLPSPEPQPGLMDKLKGSEEPQPHQGTTPKEERDSREKILSDKEKDETIIKTPEISF